MRSVDCKIYGRLSFTFTRDVLCAKPIYLWYQSSHTLYHEPRSNVDTLSRRRVLQPLCTNRHLIFDMHFREDLQLHPPSCGRHLLIDAQQSQLRLTYGMVAAGVLGGSENGFPEGNLEGNLEGNPEGNPEGKPPKVELGGDKGRRTPRGFRRPKRRGVASSKLARAALTHSRASCCSSPDCCVA
jgi:hypothetical protein